MYGSWLYICNTYFPRKHEISTKHSSTAAVVGAHMIVDGPILHRLRPGREPHARAERHHAAAAGEGIAASPPGLTDRHLAIRCYSIIASKTDAGNYLGGVSSFLRLTLELRRGFTRRLQLLVSQSIKVLLGLTILSPDESPQSRTSASCTSHS